MGAIHHPSELAGVDEEHVAAAVAEPAVLAVAREKPQARGDLRRVEELAWQRDHAIHDVGLNHANFALAGLVRRHRAVGEHEAGCARGREMMDNVLHPGIVGVAGMRHAIVPALVLANPLAAPVAHIEGWIGKDEVGL